MKGLTHIPSEQELAKLYDELQSASHDIAPERLVQGSQIARFDPRLGEQLISYFARFWRKISPIELHESLRDQVWPAALGVLLEQVPLLGAWKGHDGAVFSHWKNCVMEGIAPAKNEQYLIGLRAFGGKSMFEDALFSLSLYRKWGYLGRDVLLNKWKPGRLTLVPPEARKTARDELLVRNERFTVRDYRALLRNEVSPRQAELDLIADPRIRAVGSTRARFYTRKQAERRKSK